MVTKIPEWGTLSKQKVKALPKRAHLCSFASPSFLLFLPEKEMWYWRCSNHLVTMWCKEMSFTSVREPERYQRLGERGEMWSGDGWENKLVKNSSMSPLSRNQGREGSTQHCGNIEEKKMRGRKRAGLWSKWPCQAFSNTIHYLEQEQSHQWYSQCNELYTCISPNSQSI